MVDINEPGPWVAICDTAKARAGPYYFGLQSALKRDIRVWARPDLGRVADGYPWPRLVDINHGHDMGPPECPPQLQNHSQHVSGVGGPKAQI